MSTIDLNCDMGEGVGNDSLIMPYISSCNIACGGHSGDENSVRETLVLAKKCAVKVGAHPAYPDPQNFGRKSMSLPKQELKHHLKKQLLLFMECCSQTKSSIHHIKPHGALYNDMFQDKSPTDVFVDLIKELLPNAFVYCSPDSLLEKECQKVGLKVMREGFMDRAYNPDATLLSRSVEGAVLKNLDQIEQQLLLMVTKKQVPIVANKTIDLNVQTVCLHGDNPKAVEIIKHVHQLLKTKGIYVH
jgi:UPF0271 protein